MLLVVSSVLFLLVSGGLVSDAVCIASIISVPNLVSIARVVRAVDGVKFVNVIIIFNACPYFN